MNKKISLSISILSIIEIICCFTPFCLDKEYWEYTRSITYHGSCTLKLHSDISIFGIETVSGKLLAVLFVCAAIVVAAIYLIKTVNYTSKLTDKAWIFTIIHTAIMIIFLLYSCTAEVDKISYKYAYGVNRMFFIIIGLNLIILISAIFLKLNNTAELPIKEQTAVKETLDDLPAYKELLDSGVITQEEFELKKKQILGL